MIGGVLLPVESMAKEGPFRVTSRDLSWSAKYVGLPSKGDMREACEIRRDGPMRDIA
jgi:hypothetical protein